MRWGYVCLVDFEESRSPDLVGGSHQSTEAQIGKSLALSEQGEFPHTYTAHRHHLQCGSFLLLLGGIVVVLVSSP